MGGGKRGEWGGGAGEREEMQIEARAARLSLERPQSARVFGERGSKWQWTDGGTSKLALRLSPNAAGMFHYLPADKLSEVGRVVPGEGGRGGRGPQTGRVRGREGQDMDGGEEELSSLDWASVDR